MRMIDADKLLDDITAIENSSGMGYIIASTFKWHVNQQPTITIPEIIYCQDCENYWDLNGKHICVKLNCNCPDDSEFFCKFGRKKDENTTD